MNVKKKGLALIVVVGVLGVLAALALAFVAMAQLERRASQQRVHAAKAYLLARSGIEDALARIGAGQDPRYGGEDWDADSSLSGFERNQEVHRPGTLDMDACPVRHAMRPSFAAMGGADPRLVAVDGRQRGYSGRLQGDLAWEGSTYALKVASEGGFFVNGGDPAAQPGEGYNAVLRRMLGTLAEAIDREDGTDDSKPVSETDGWRLIDARPTDGWPDLKQIRDLALGGSQAKLEAIREYLTLRGRPDLKVIAPNATPAMIHKNYHSWGEIKLDHAIQTGNPDPRALMSRAPDFERIQGRIVGRSPVDLAWARTRRPALIALLAGLKGLHLDETTARPWFNAGDLMRSLDVTDNFMRINTIGALRPADIRNVWSASDDCHLIAQQILASTRELRTWQDWNTFCNSLALPDVDPAWAGWSVLERTVWIADLKQAKRDLLKAAFNPESDLNKFNPNPTLWRSVDKSDLLAYSTEWSLLPELAPLRVESAGRVLDPAGRVLAIRSLRVERVGLLATRLTTQREFVCGHLAALGLAGDEIGSRLPGEAAVPFLSRSEGMQKTWGHALGRPGLGEQGAGLQPYPEPCTDPGTGLAISPADYDGNLQLATVETPRDAWYGTSSDAKDMKMLARFDDGFDLDVADGLKTCRPDLGIVTPPEMGNSLLHALRPNTLQPDGAYSEATRAPIYLDFLNAHGFHGVLSLWAKPNYRLMPFPRSGLEGRNRPYVTRSNMVEPSAGETASPNQLFFLGDARYTPRDVSGLALQFENGHVAVDIDIEHLFATSGPMGGPHAWRLVTALWDFRSPTADDTGEIISNGGGDGTTGARNIYGDGNNWLAAADITLPDLYGPHRLALGTCSEFVDITSSACIGQGADATFDEFALYDFGGAEPFVSETGPGIAPAPEKTKASPGLLASNRYKEGRYYKGAAYAPAWAPGTPDEAGSWVSAPIQLPPGSVLKKVAWTWYRPKELPTDYAEVELLSLSVTSYLWDESVSRSTQTVGWGPDRQDWQVDRPVPGPFRARVLFRRTHPVDLNTPILDSPVFDDLTFVYTPAGDAAILAWGEGE